MNVEESTAQDILNKCMAGEEKDEDLHPEFIETRNMFFSQLAIEVQRSIDAFSILFAVDHVDKIYLCGTGAYCPGIAAHMQKTLGVRTKLFDPFSRVTQEKLHESIRSRSAIFAVAFGLAIP
jgi:Tfp pilus assembly PilM family ATPase